MAFNHYAKLKGIIDAHPEGWYIRRINEPTTAQNFRGEKISYDHYYRLYDANNQPIKFGKFQKIDKLAQILGVDTIDLPIVEDL
jgi:hypothetical protein